MRDAVCGAERGSYPVGVGTSEAADPENPGRVPLIDLWYPAADPPPPWTVRGTVSTERARCVE